VAAWEEHLACLSVEQTGDQQLKDEEGYGPEDDGTGYREGFRLFRFNVGEFGRRHHLCISMRSRRDAAAVEN
jgi:hypothetical protein